MLYSQTEEANNIPRAVPMDAEDMPISKVPALGRRKLIVVVASVVIGNGRIDQLININAFRGNRHGRRRISRRVSGPLPHANGRTPQCLQKTWRMLSG